MWRVPRPRISISNAGGACGLATAGVTLYTISHTQHGRLSASEAKTLWRNLRVALARVVGRGWNGHSINLRGGSTLAMDAYCLGCVCDGAKLTGRSGRQLLGARRMGDSVCHMELVCSPPGCTYHYQPLLLPETGVLRSLLGSHVAHNITRQQNCKVAQQTL